MRLPWWTTAIADREVSACDRCGALVLPDFREKHLHWHELIGDVDA